MKFSWLKRSFLIRNNQSGRSMTEMIGVLILVGILSMGALGGYGWAMDKYRSNTLSREVLQRAATLKTQLDRRNRDVNLKKFENNSLIRYPIGLEPGTPYTENGKTTVGIQVNDVSKRVCQMTFDSNIGLFDIKVESTLYQKKTDKDTSDVCQNPDKNTMIFYIDDAWEYGRDKTEICPDGRLQCSSDTECDQVAGEQCIDNCCQPNDCSYTCSSDNDCADGKACIGGCCKQACPSTSKSKICYALDNSSYTCCAPDQKCLDGTCVDDTICSDGLVFCELNLDCCESCTEEGYCENSGSSSSSSSSSSSGSSSSGGSSSGGGSITSCSCEDVGCAKRSHVPRGSGLMSVCCSGGISCRGKKEDGMCVADYCTSGSRWCQARDRFCALVPSCPTINMAYNSASKTCECIAGYVLEGDECVAATEILYTSEMEISTATATPGVTITTSPLGTDMDCESGYISMNGVDMPYEGCVKRVTAMGYNWCCPISTSIPGTDTTSPLGTETPTVTPGTQITATQTQTPITGLTATATPTDTTPTGTTATGTTATATPSTTPTDTTATATPTDTTPTGTTATGTTATATPSTTPTDTTATATPSTTPTDTTATPTTTTETTYPTATPSTTPTDTTATLTTTTETTYPTTTPSTTATGTTATTTPTDTTATPTTTTETTTPTTTPTTTTEYTSTATPTTMTETTTPMTTTPTTTRISTTTTSAPRTSTATTYTTTVTRTTDTTTEPTTTQAPTTTPTTTRVSTTTTSAPRTSTATTYTTTVTRTTETTTEPTTTQAPTTTPTTTRVSTTTTSAPRTSTSTRYTTTSAPTTITRTTDTTTESTTTARYGETTTPNYGTQTYNYEMTTSW